MVARASHEEVSRYAAWAIGTPLRPSSRSPFVVTLTMTWRDLRARSSTRPDTADVLASSLTHPMWEVDMDQVVAPCLDAAYENHDVAAAWVDDERGPPLRRASARSSRGRVHRRPSRSSRAAKASGRSSAGHCGKVARLRTVKEAFQRQLSSAIALVGCSAAMVLVLFRLPSRFTGRSEQMSEAVGRHAQGVGKVELPAVDTDDEVVGNLSPFLAARHDDRDRRLRGRAARRSTSSRSRRDSPTPPRRPSASSSPR